MEKWRSVCILKLLRVSIVSIVFGSKHKFRSKSVLDIKCNGTFIKPTKSVKYLGVTLDQHSSFVSMANAVLMKANSRLKFLYGKRSSIQSFRKSCL